MFDLWPAEPRRSEKYCTLEDHIFALFICFWMLYIINIGNRTTCLSNAEIIGFKNFLGLEAVGLFQFGSPRNFSHPIFLGIQLLLKSPDGACVLRRSFRQE